MQNDRFSECFLKITPQNNMTFSNREMPCRFEPPLQPTTSRQECPFHVGGFCSNVSDSVLGLAIQRAYSEKTKSTLNEASTSIVVRSEHHFHTQDLFRTTQRRHFYEGIQAGSGDWSRFGIHCSPMDVNDRYGEYLGFLDLREHFNRSPLAFALLVEPGSIREDPNAFVIRGDYGPLFGAHSFRSTVYSMQDPKTTGAMCAQACIIMALGMLGDRKSEIKGSFTVTYLGQLTRLAKEKKSREESTKAPGRTRSLQEFLEEVSSEIDAHVDSEPYNSFEVGGLNPEEVRDVLRQCNVGAELNVIRHEKALPNAGCSPSEREAMRVIEANIRARFPVILSVNGKTWTQDENCNPDVGHAVTIVGFRRNVAGEAISLIVHDPASQPFLERSPRKCLEAAREHRVVDPKTGEQKPGNRYSFVVALEKSVRFHAHECIEWLRSDHRERMKFAPFYLCSKGTNYRICAANALSVFRILAPEVAQQHHVRVFEDRILKNIARVWCVVTYNNGQFHVAWLFDANMKRAQYVLRLAKTSDGYNATVFNDEGKQETYPL
jgi:hypothetical protein